MPDRPMVIVAVEGGTMTVRAMPDNYPEKTAILEQMHKHLFDLRRALGD